MNKCMKSFSNVQFSSTENSTSTIELLEGKVENLGETQMHESDRIIIRIYYLCNKIVSDD